MSVRSDIRDAMWYGLTTITAGGTIGGYTYLNTIYRAYDVPRSFQEMLEFPCVNIIMGREDRQSERPIVSNNQFLDLHTVVRLDVYLAEPNDIQQAQDNIIADIMAYVGNNYYLPSSTGARTCFEVAYKGSEPFGTEIERPNCGVMIDIDVWYRVKVSNPNTMV